MDPLRYDEPDLVRRLDQLPPALKAAFAAACAQRLMQVYEAFTRVSGRGDPARLASILDRLWIHLKGGAMSAQERAGDLETVMSLIPQEDDEPWFAEQAGAEDAGAALAYALRTLSGGESQEAAWAARCAYETVDHHLRTAGGIDPASPGGEERLMRHPLMQAELSRQLRDLDDLGRAAAKEDGSIVDRIRSRAIGEGKEMLS